MVISKIDTRIEKEVIVMREKNDRYGKYSTIIMAVIAAPFLSSLVGLTCLGMFLLLVLVLLYFLGFGTYAFAWFFLCSLWLYTLALLYLKYQVKRK
jgi:Zn-dependent protease with chaperone function